MESSLAGRGEVIDMAWQALRRRGSVLVEGPAGIGKTAVLRTLSARAEADGMVVLRCAPSEAETALPLAAIADLLQPLVGGIDRLPGPQADAVAAALSGDSTARVDERALAAGTRALLDDAATSADAGLLVSIDDPIWLDPPSERVLRFTLRRTAGNVAVLVTCRVAGAEPAQVPLDLDAVPAGSGEPVVRIPVGPLAVGALYQALAAHFGVRLGRPLFTRLAAASGGNPLLAIELTRAVRRLPQPVAPGDDLPIPGSMQGLVAASLDRLSSESLRAARLASLLSHPTLGQLAAAGVDPGAFDPAEEAGLLSVTASEVVEFAHPVHAAAVRTSIPTGVRRRLHATLAASSDDPDERARQLARSTSAPNGRIAAELEDAARRARRRGAPEFAAEFWDRAAELTPVDDVDDRQRRRAGAIHCRFDTGDFTTAAAEADSLAAESSGDCRSDALLLKAAIAWSTDDIAGAVDAAQRAVAGADTGSRLIGRAHAYLGCFVEEPAAARHHAEAALALLSVDAEAEPGGIDIDSGNRGDLLAQDDRSLLASTLLLQFYNEVRLGEPAREELLDRALGFERSTPHWLGGTVPAIWWKTNDDRDRAVARLIWIFESATAFGDEPFRLELICHLAETELLAGRYAAADRWTVQALQLGEQLASGLVAERWLAALLDTHRGELNAASEAAAAGLRHAEESDDAWARRLNLQLSGFVALAAGRMADAAGHFTALAARLDEIGLIEPLGTRFESDWVEACVATGDLDTAALAQDRLAARHARLPRPWTTLGLARGAALLTGAHGLDTEPAIDALLAERDAVPGQVIPFDRARCLLVAGVALRRAKRKRAARDALTSAAAEFDALGSVPFAARARAEATRLGGRPSTPLELSATELAIADLAARGATNRAIADAVFVSPKTVEANLGRTYRKLGIGGRAELGTALAARIASNT